MSKSTFNDKTPMPFGKYKGEAMENVPAGYLLWLYEQMKRDDEKINLFIYIAENRKQLEQEADEEKRDR